MNDTFQLKLNKMTLLLLSLVTGATCMFVFREYIFGNRILAFYDIGSDTAEQYLSLYAMLIRKLQTGDLTLWGANNGFGINLNMLNMTNPALMIVYLLGAVIGTERMPYLMVWIYMAEILCAGICCYLYLSVFRLDERAKAMASYMYCFSGFIMVWGQHYQFAIVPSLLVLEMLFVERCIRCPRKWKSLTIMTAFLVFNSMYIAYMCLIFCGFYVCVRVLIRHLRSFPSYFFRVFHLAWVMGLGVGIGFITLLPAVAAILSVSSRLATQDSLSYRLFGIQYPSVYYSTLVSRFFGTTFKGISDYRGHFNYYEDPCLFFSILFALLLVQYVFLIPSISERVAGMAAEAGKRYRVNKIKLIVIQYVLLVFVGACVSWPGTGTIFNGFTTFFSRYMFICMPYFALIASYTLTEIIRNRKVNYIALAIGLAVTVRFCLVYYIDPGMPNPKYAALAHLICCVLMALVLVLFSLDSLDFLRRYLIIALCVFLAADVSVDAFSNFHGRDTVLKGGKYFEELYDTDTANALRWIRENDSQWYRVEKTYGATMATDSMVQDYHPISAYNSTQNANIQNYINMYWDDVLYMDINHYLYVLGSADTDQSGLCGIKYVLSRNSEAVLPGTEQVFSSGDVYVYRFTDVNNICSYYPYSEVSKTFGKASDGFTDTVTVNFEEKDPKAKLIVLDGGKDDRITANVTVIQQGVLFFAIPFENGWSVYVDGEKKAMRKANEGFIGVDLEAGTHEITLKYLCPGLVKGMIITIFSIILLILFSVLENMRDRSVDVPDDWTRTTPVELIIAGAYNGIRTRIDPTYVPHPPAERQRRVREDGSPQRESSRERQGRVREDGSLQREPSRKRAVRVRENGSPQREPSRKRAVRVREDGSLQGDTSRERRKRRRTGMTSGKTGEGKASKSGRNTAIVDPEGSRTEARPRRKRPKTASSGQRPAGKNLSSEKLERRKPRRAEGSADSTRRVKKRRPAGDEQREKRKRADNNSL